MGAHVVAIFAISDPDGHYVSFVSNEDTDFENARAAVNSIRRTIRDALRSLEGVTEAPRVGIVSPSPGTEDLLLQGLATELG